MLSLPPASITSASPHFNACTALMIARKLEPQALLIVNAGTASGTPARLAI